MSNLVFKAHKFAKGKHGKQLDDSGLNYFDSHVQQVFILCSIVTEDEDILSASLLHDTIEDTETTYEELVAEFNKRIADLVMEVTHDGTKTAGYIFPRLKSKDAILIKFADRLSNLSRMESWSEQRQAHYLKRSRFWKEQH